MSRVILYQGVEELRSFSFFCIDVSLDLLDTQSYAIRIILNISIWPIDGTLMDDITQCRDGNNG